MYKRQVQRTHSTVVRSHLTFHSSIAARRGLGCVHGRTLPWARRVVYLYMLLHVERSWPKMRRIACGCDVLFCVEASV